jgi:predicted nuclease of restriction endonuclease-like (RecB) superfamily
LSVSLIRQLSWIHILVIIPMADPLRREFYIQLCAHEKWSVRTFRDPYSLDFLGLKDAYSEKDLETSIVLELQRFITELGTDFAFMARQKGISVDNTDYRIDLLFYNRRLRSLVAIDRKIGAFEAAYKGEMELYLEKHEVVEGEGRPIGLMLCTSKSEEHIELLQLDKSNIRVANT